MKKELKYLLYIITILGFIIFVTSYYFSDKNVKNSYRAVKFFEKDINEYSNNLITLNSDTNNIIEYVEDTINKNSKKYKFWELLFNNEK